MMYNFSPAALSARVDAVLDAVLQQQRLVGAVVLVRQRGQDVYRRAAGLLDREAGTPMREDAVFRLASVSKPIVSTAALARVGQHRLGLDDLVARWLPYFAPRQPDGTVAAMSVRHLLTHTAGLDYGFFQPPDGAYALARQLGENQTAAFDLPFWPGRGFGLGFTVLTDPQLAATPEAAGTWRMGGTYGHSWFVDPAQELSVVAFTNTALEGMAGPFVTELCQAVYGVEQGQ